MTCEGEFNAVFIIVSLVLVTLAVLLVSTYYQGEKQRAKENESDKKKREQAKQEIDAMTKQFDSDIEMVGILRTVCVYHKGRRLFGKLHLLDNGDVFLEHGNWHIPLQNIMYFEFAWEKGKEHLFYQAALQLKRWYNEEWCSLKTTKP